MIFKPLLSAQTIAAVESIASTYARDFYNSRARRKLPINRPFQPRDLRIFMPAIRELSSMFTDSRSTLRMKYFNTPELRTAYALYFFAINYAKTYQLASELFTQTKSILSKKSLSILDIGAGLGASLFGFLSALDDNNFKGAINASAIDSNTAVLSDLKRIQPLFETLDRVSIYTRMVDLKRGFHHDKGGQLFDIVLLVNVLNEIGKGYDQLLFQSKLLTTIVQDVLSEDGILLIIEPAMPVLSHKLGALHDVMLELRSLWQPCSPCTGTFPCPARTGRDWCHTWRLWHQPPLSADIDKMLQHDNARLKFCQLVLSKDSGSQRNAHRATHTVLSAPLAGEGRDWLLLCSSKGLSKMPLQRSDKAPPRGAQIAIEPIEWIKRDGILYPRQDKPVAWKL